MYDAIEDEHLSERVICYIKHRHQLVGHHNQFLADIDLTQLSGMRRKTKKKWVNHLDIARMAWEIESEQRRKN